MPLADNPFKKAEKIIEESTTQEKAREIKQEIMTRKQADQLEKLSAVASFDWKAVPPPVLAQVLINMPFKGASGDPDYFLQPWQAMVFAMRCYELGLSPFSNEVWFNPKNNKVNVTFEGKLKLARDKGMNLGPPHFTRVERQYQGKPDFGYHCTMTSPSGTAEYTAWLSEWRVATSPVWREKPDHMLQLRAAEKCLSFASGIGSSELPDDRDIEQSADKPIPQVEATEFVEKT